MTASRSASTRSLARRVVGRVRRDLGRGPANVRFWWTRRRATRPRIFYLLTPFPALANVGDESQRVAITEWLERRFPEVEVVELDKHETRALLPALRRVVRADDLVLLHSGGNLSDRAPLSEGIRRRVLAALRHVPVVQLPQTVFFADTPTGVRERARTERIYATHPDLTIVARDPHSERVARGMFPYARVVCFPDFALLLEPPPPRPGSGGGRVLLCLRRDDESVLDPPARERLRTSLAAATTVIDTTVIDTTLDQPIDKGERDHVVRTMLTTFADHDVVVTDRFHGVVFSVVCGRPCVVLPTVDHKLTAGMSWFDGVASVTLVRSPDEVPTAIARVTATPAPTVDLQGWRTCFDDDLVAAVPALSRLAAVHASDRSQEAS